MTKDFVNTCQLYHEVDRRLRAIVELLEQNEHIDHSGIDQWVRPVAKAVEDIAMDAHELYCV